MKISSQHLQKLQTIFLSVFLSISSFSGLAQEDMFDLSLDSATQSIESYNQSKDDIEYLIRERECLSESKFIIEEFQRELAALNKIIDEVDFKDIRSKVEGNSYVIISEYKEGDCLLLMYKKVKYLKGCLEPVILKDIDWAPYDRLLANEKEGKLCIMPVQSSGYTQVEKIPSAELTKKSADMLLRKIERVLNAYPDKIGVSFEQYQGYETKKNLSDLKDVIKLRTAFLNKCRTKLQ